MHHMAGVIPINYEIMFEPLFHNFKFNGEEVITLNLSKLSNSNTGKIAIGLLVFEINSTVGLSNK